MSPTEPVPASRGTAPAGRIHDISYRHLDAALAPGRRRFWPITRRGIVTLYRRSRFVRVLLWLAWAPALVKGVQIYIARSVDQMPSLGRLASQTGLLRIDAEFLLGAALGQGLWLWLALLACARLISDDLKAGALQVYLAKPITRLDYVLGKAGVVGGLLGMVLVLPTLAVYLTAVLLNPDGSFLRQHGWALVPLLGFELFVIATLTLLVLGLSSLSVSGAFVTVLLLGAYLFSEAVGGILGAIYRDPRLQLLGLWTNYEQIGHALFGLTPPHPVPAAVSAAITLGLAGLAALVLRWRVRAVQVVA
ncbi:MAG TPA: hypothetical protein VGB99_06640 [Acidobacteriota bacterium]